MRRASDMLTPPVTPMRIRMMSSSLVMMTASPFTSMGMAFFVGYLLNSCMGMDIGYWVLDLWTVWTVIWIWVLYIVYD
ncbi:hypothetical protein EON63_18380 [archaeon]|nr:MAG: hypothetical protein EON63_18380 [archaeon]